MIECMKTAAKLPERNEEKAIEEKENKKQTEHIYISGPITGTPDYMERFEKAEKELTENGYSVINPAKVNAMLPQDVGRIYKSIIDAVVDLHRSVHDAGLEGEPWCST